MSEIQELLDSETLQDFHDAGILILREIEDRRLEMLACSAATQVDDDTRYAHLQRLKERVAAPSVKFPQPQPQYFGGIAGRWHP